MLHVCTLPFCHKSCRKGRQEQMTSGYLSDHETKLHHEMVQQQISLESQDSRMCYLTSSEVMSVTFCTLPSNTKRVRLLPVDVRRREDVSHHRHLRRRHGQLVSRELAQHQLRCLLQLYWCCQEGWIFVSEKMVDTQKA